MDDWRLAKGAEAQSQQAEMRQLRRRKPLFLNRFLKTNCAPLWLGRLQRGVFKGFWDI